MATAVGGTKLGLLAFTDNEPEWEATDGRAGVFYAYRGGYVVRLYL